MAITRDSRLTLEAYAKVRNSNHAELIVHRKLRTVRLDEHLSVRFEDETTIRRQIQEMRHIEKIFDEAGIESEIAAYAPLIPGGTKWKATSACSPVCNSSSLEAGTFTKNGPASLRRYTPSSTKCRACGRLSVSSCSSRACV
jgi:hypothetical protein